MVSHENPDPVPPWTAGQFVGGHPGLDFVNTVSDRVDATLAIERLREPKDLATWLQSAGLVTPTQAKLLARNDAAWLGPILSIREAGWRLLEPIAAGCDPDPAALGTLLTVAGASLDSLASIDEAGSAQLASLDADDTDAIRESLLSLLALQILDAYFVLPRARFRCCPRCGWLFYDRSRGGRRRWCKMETCGNREKAKRYSARQAK